MVNHLFTFGMAFAVSAGATPVVRYLAFRLGMLDQPGFRKVHRTPMPLLGGLAIYLGVAIAVVTFAWDSGGEQMLGILTGATLLLIVGVMDDTGVLHHQVKLMIAMPIAAIVLMASGVHSEIFVDAASRAAHPFSLAAFADYALTFVWVVGITAAFSILDHLDGLCSGIASLASAFALLFAAANGQVLVGTLAAATFGASLAFLQWNFNPARIFMGDGGAIFLGFTVATICLKLRLPMVEPSVSHMVPPLIAVVPIFDTTLVTVSRLRRGLLPFSSPGKDHTAHRLANLGLGHRGAVVAMYTLGLTGGVAAIVISRLSPNHAYVVAAVVIAVAAAAIAALERAPFERQRVAVQPINDDTPPEVLAR